MRYKVSEIAPAVDKVLGEQFENMLSAFAPVVTEIPKVDSFKLDIETIEEAASNEASEVSTAKPDEVVSASESPRMELS